MVGRFGEAPQKIRAQGARTPSPPTPQRETPTRSNAPQCLCPRNLSSERERRSWGEACSPDPYLLRVDEARDQRLVARLSGGAECDSAWSGEHASPQLWRGGNRSSARGKLAEGAVPGFEEAEVVLARADGDTEVAGEPHRGTVAHEHARLEERDADLVDVLAHARQHEVGLRGGGGCTAPGQLREEARAFREDEGARLLQMRDVLEGGDRRHLG